jgi:N-methylhydantoinase A
VGVAKTDTTPPRFDEGVLASMEKAGVAPADMMFFAHGSTVVINALTERKGARTALITTRGFRDVLEIARGNRPDLFNFNFRKPPPFVERRLRLELAERTNYKGEIVTPVDLAPLEGAIGFLRREAVEAVAVVFLHAYINPENERRAASEIRRLWPEVSVVASHEISREWREYERTNTTVLSACVHPVAKRYIESLESKLAAQGFSGAPYMMLSNGGVATAAAAKRNPIAMVESGPASGINAAAHLGQAIGEANLIVLDIGGTTAKCALIENGEVKVSTDYHIEKTRKNPGYPIQTPVSEIVEIGNGGGSIAWVDAGGKLHVGPQSAGAAPGPAAYGRGGTQPTTTDANLVLGRIDPASFAGGEIEPDWRAVDLAMAPLCQKLGLDHTALARGIVRIANANMTNALRLVSTNKGYDPRDFALVAFGGGGAMHAVALAEELRIPKVIVPANSSVFSAWGMLLCDLRRDYLQTRPLTLGPDAAEAILDTFRSLEARAREEFAEDGVSGRSGLAFEHLADMRYFGQEHTVKVAFAFNGAGRADLGAAAAAFHDAHEKRFTYRLDTPVEIVNFHVVAMAPIDKPELARKPVTGKTADEAAVSRRRVDFDPHGVHDAVIYDGLALEPGMTFEGPAVVQEPAVSLVVPPGGRVSVDEFGNYHVHLTFEDGER